MAEIKMDISEYEAMKENKRLLENSLQKERDLNDEIKKLNTDKTKALEDAKMKVVKISKSEINEYYYKKKNDYDTFKTLHSFVSNYASNNAHSHSPTSYFNIDGLIDNLFDKIKTTSIPYEEITTYGLDEVKSEIRNDLKEKMDGDIKTKLERAEKISIRNNELITENKTLVNENLLLNDLNKNLMTQVDELNKKVTYASIEVTKINNHINHDKEVLFKIKDILKDGYGFWNKSELLNKVTTLIK